MDESVIDTEGRCPRCQSEDIEREVILQTTSRVVSGVVFFCNTCGLKRQALASDREAWFNQHKLWRSPGVPEATFEEFDRRWPKKVFRVNYGSPEPLGPILPGVPSEPR
ncbi:MAG: hypothetical protein EP329_22010 [Deltaproteobacteria bacterium]|nr:MAG: hypothetical protein EP329_22010 [Deltaproteobacteria bacterium]